LGNADPARQFGNAAGNADRLFESRISHRKLENNRTD
jgi:hypothetical protein